MKWISLNEETPQIGQPVLVWKSKEIVKFSTYPVGVYIASYEKVWRNTYCFAIEDRDRDNSNVRPADEFSHWMPLPNQPERLSEETPEKVMR